MVNPEVLIGTVIDNRYRLSRTIGKGSYGWVFEATEEIAGQFVGQVAVKLLAPEDDLQRDMVLREIRALAGFTHEYIIAYRTSGQIAEGTLAGTIFLVTELGEVALSTFIPPQERLPDDDIWTLGRGIALALSHIHAKGSVHRDVKPENVLRVDGRWKLGDFGLVRAVEGAQMSGSGAKGTLRYMAPETLDNEITAASDVYALGVTLLRCLTGRYAHEGETEAQFMSKLLSAAPYLPPELPDRWVTILGGCLERDTSRRWSAAQLAQQLGAGSQSVERPSHAAAIAEPAQTGSGPDHPASTDRTIRLDKPGLEPPPRRSEVDVVTVEWSWAGAPVSSSPTLTPDSTSDHTLHSYNPKPVHPRKAPVKLRLAGDQKEAARRQAEVVEAMADEAFRIARGQRRGPSRLLPILAVVLLLVLGAGAYGWKSGMLGDVVQRLISSAMGVQKPLQPDYLELTVLAQGPKEVRSAPRHDAPILGVVKRNARVKSVGQRGDWYEILMPTGGTAYIHESAFSGEGSSPAAYDSTPHLDSPERISRQPGAKSEPRQFMRNRARRQELRRRLATDPEFRRQFRERRQAASSGRP